MEPIHRIHENNQGTLGDPQIYEGSKEQFCWAGSNPVALVMRNVEVHGPSFSKGNCTTPRAESDRPELGMYRASQVFAGLPGLWLCEQRMNASKAVFFL